MTLTNDIEESALVGALATGISYAFYGMESVRIPVLDQNFPKAAYIGITSFLGSLLSNVLLEYDEPIPAAAASVAFSIGANELVGRPVAPAIIGAVASVPKYGARSRYQ